MLIENRLRDPRDRSAAPTVHSGANDTLPALFEAQVERTPYAIAVAGRDGQLTYGGLNARANRLAHLLIGCGVGPEDVVGLAMPRSAEAIVALLAIAKAGAAYLPLDPDYPAARLEVMLDDVPPRAVMTTSAMRSRL